MNYQEAKQLLRTHVGMSDLDQGGDELEEGFIPSLRPYRGLREDNFHLVMEALLTVGEQVRTSTHIERDLIATIWSLCYYARMWGLRPSGMLQRNKLITVQDSTRLELWVDTIEQTALGLLDGQPLYQVIQHYAAYVVTVGGGRNIGFFIPIMERAVSDPVQLPPAMILSALAKLGAAAVSVLPSLHETLKRLDSWTAAQFGATDDNLIIVKERHRLEVQQTIDAIEGRAGNVKG